MKITRKRVLLSLLSVALCFAMLVGTTYAWFTDTVISADNKIQAGNLKLDLERLDKKTGNWKSIKESQEPLFNEQNWEPGYTSVTILKVENEGNLALKWQARFVSSGEISSLAKAIDVYVKPSQTELTYPAKDEITSANGWNMVGTLDKFIDTLSNTTYGRLLSNESAYLGIALHMREDAGNEYQNLTLGAFDIRIVATQASHESDGFGTPDYDNDAEYPEFEMSFEQKQSLEGVSTIYNELANELVIRHEATGAYAVLPVGVKLKAGVTELAFSGKSLCKNEGNVGDDERSYDIHIEGIAENNQKCITVYIGKILPAGLGDTEVKLYHEDVQMTRANSVADFARPDQFTYDPATGAVVLYVENFSVFTAVEATADEWDGTSDTTWYNENDTEFTLMTAEQFAGFRDLVDRGNTFAGKTVKLGTDIDLARIPFDPIGFGYYNAETNTRVFMGTFDGAGHTIYNLYENCWELDPDKTNYSTYTYSTAGAGLFASIKDATIKNLAISGAEIVFECVDMGVVVGYAQGTCHFENIVVTDSNIANYNRYTGGVVGEVSYGPYGIDTSMGYSHTFKNVVVDSTVKVSGLWGSFGCGMGGVIGGKWGDATVKMENVISAAEMDVYNDVVSAYQWYAFRGCGMLIGHTEEPYSDGRHSGNAEANFLTCNNVDVYYGDWVNYHYYEFEDQDNATGQRYPWVRAEAGEYCDAFSNIRYGVPTHNGIKVSDLTEEELKAIATDYTPIVFDQLYGADRGMYGTATHEGVTVSYKNKTTIYIENNLGWENLKLYYWCKNGEDRWTTVVEGIELTEENGVYKVELPAFAHSYKIVADGDNETREFYLSEVTENETYNLDFEHVHYFMKDKCDCGAVKQFTEHQFTLGEDGEAKHSDGGNEITAYEENGFTLTLEGTGSLYGNARDEMGNSCIKLGTSSLTGKFSFTVPENVEKVIIYVAGYKENVAKVSVNNVEYEITTLSNNGEYTAIEVDTSETKKVSFTTVYFKGESRCMINTISFATSRVVEVHDCDENEEIPEVAPTCTETGLTAGKACSVCGKVMVAQEIVEATGHTEETIPAVDATCTKNGLTEGTKCSVCNEILVAQETVISLGHNYVLGICSVCGESFPQTSGTYTYVFSEYTAGIQYAENEEHKLDEYVTMFTTQCHFTSELRIYSSGEHNGYVIIKSANPISAIDVNAGNKEDTINIYGSNDGTNWTAESIATISVTSTSYNDYTAELEDEYKYLKLDVAGGNQVRIKSMTLTTVPDCAHSSTTTETIAPTCTEVGYTVEKCSSCGKEMSRTNEVAATGHVNTTTDEKAATCSEDGYTKVTCACGYVVSEVVIPATGEHTYVDGTCSSCGETETAEPIESTEPESTVPESTEPESTEPETTEPTWTKVELGDIKSTDVIVIVWTTSNGTAYAISNDKGTSSAPTAVVVTVSGDKLSGDIADSIKWNISNNNGNLTIYPNGTTSTWLYCTSSNNGVRVGTNTNKVFTIDANSGYLKHTGTSRYLGVYTANPDVRCYTSTTTNIANQTLAFYKLTSSTGGEGGETPVCTNKCETCQKCKDKNCTLCKDKCACSQSGTTDPTVVLEITKDDFKSTSYADNNNTKTENGYSYTSYQVMNQSSVMQWQKSKGYITIASNDFVKLEIKVTAGTYTVTVGGKTVNGTTTSGVTTYDLTGLTGEVKISVGSAMGKVEYLKFYK